jgi:uncharacterized protein YqgC (DUF456 family)
MDLFFLLVGFLLMWVGIAGSILPVLPGTPISWLGLVVLYLSPSIDFDWLFISITGIVAIGLYILDYLIPAWGTQRFGGSKAGAWGATLGLLIGLIAPIPLGILLGPILGALIGELVFNKSHGPKAVRAAFGSFIGLLASTMVKFLATLLFMALFIYKVIVYWNSLQFL